MHNLPYGFDVYLVIVKTNCSASFCGLLRKVNFMNGQRQARTYVPEEEEKNDAKKPFNSRRNASGVSTITSFLLTIKNSARFLQRSQIVSRYVKNVFVAIPGLKQFISVIYIG